MVMAKSKASAWQQERLLPRNPDMDRPKKELSHESVREACLAQRQPRKSFLSLFIF